MEPEQMDVAEDKMAEVEMCNLIEHFRKLANEHATEYNQMYTEMAEAIKVVESIDSPMGCPLPDPEIMHALSRVESLRAQAALKYEAYYTANDQLLKLEDDFKMISLKKQEDDFKMISLMDSIFDKLQNLEKHPRRMKYCGPMERITIVNSRGRDVNIEFWSCDPDVNVCIRARDFIYARVVGRETILTCIDHLVNEDIGEIMKLIGQ